MRDPNKPPVNGCTYVALRAALHARRVDLGLLPDQSAPGPRGSTSMCHGLGGLQVDWLVSSASSMTARMSVTTSTAARDHDDTAPAMGDAKATSATTMPRAVWALRTRRRPPGTTTPERRLTHPVGSLSTPRYTAQMGHWSESLVDDAAAKIGGDPDREALRQMFVQTGREIEVLSGRSFRELRRWTVNIESGGLPFVDIPDLQVGSMEAVETVHEIPDPVNPQIATVMQVAPLIKPLSKAAPVGDAL